MNDKELLELAAKAAEMGLEWQAGWNGMPTIATFCEAVWNPLTNDGDALRLAVKLKIDTKHYAAHVVCWYEDYFGTGKIFYGNDEYAATRRAIVRAAAEIGKSMP